VLCFASLLALPSPSSSSSTAQSAEFCQCTGREKAAVHLVSCGQYCGELWAQLFLVFLIKKRTYWFVQVRSVFEVMAHEDGGRKGVREGRKDGRTEERREQQEQQQ
jgi:hypothetical protein